MEIKLDYLFCVFVIALFSTILHELAHGAMAYALGDDTAKLSGRLSLNPLKHIDPMMSVVMPLIFAALGMPILGGAKPVPINTRNLKWGEWGFALVAIAGPLTNFVLAFVFYALWALVAQSGFWGTFFAVGVMVNLGFMLFNLIPIPPLDGSRVLYALAPDFVRNIMMSMERYGIIVIYLLLCFCGSLFANYMGWAENGILTLFYTIFGV